VFDVPGGAGPTGSDLPLGGPVPPGAPEDVADRVPLPYCGAASVFPNSGVNPFMGIEVVGEAEDCYQRRAGAGLPAEMIEIRSTTEGDPVLVIRRALPDGREETFSDMTRDAFGTQAWFRLVCSGYRPPGSQVEDCEPSEQLIAPDPAPPASTLFEITSADSEAGPPFYVTADSVTAAAVDAWATQQFTIVSEWRTPIAVVAPPSRYVLDSRRISRPAAGETAGGEPIVIQPGASLALLIVLEPLFATGPAPGVYEIEVPIAFWRDVDPTAKPAGPPENTLTVRITYEILDARAVSAIGAFCGRAIVATADLAEIDQQRLNRGLEAIESAAAELPPSKRDDLLADTAALRLQLEEMFGPEPGHSGFSTVRIIESINRLCGTNLLAISVQS